MKHHYKLNAETLYNHIAGDEDARVCKDIPPEACNEQPRNFFAYLGANLVGKIADEISSAKLVIPWIFGALGVPAAFTGFLVPVREACKLLPQMAIAAYIRRMPMRKNVWILGAWLSAACLFGMAIAAFMLRGALAGIIILFLLIFFSLAEGLCSVSAKDVLGKTVSKSKRGRLMGWSAGISGIAVLCIGFAMSLFSPANTGIRTFAVLLAAGGTLWIIGALIFGTIVEQPGATEGGGNALSTAMQQLRLLTHDRPFRLFVIARGLLLSTALAPPFYVLVAREQTQANPAGLGILIIANGLAASLSAPIWGRLGDRSSRTVMATASAGAGLLALFTFIAVQGSWEWANGKATFAIIFFLLNVMHSGLRLGRKVYLVDMSNTTNRAAYVAVSNTAIGVLMLAGGLLGILGDLIGAASTVLILGLFALLAAVYAWFLPEVSEPV